MIVSWDWLQQYVALDMTPDELAERVMMAGLNHEETRAVGDDLAIELEVTSNRPDCLGHLGVAREISVLWDVSLRVPAAAPKESKVAVEDLATIRVDNPRECPRYTARVIRNVRIGSSPAWLVRRLATIGVASINNVVDVTNYVMLECGQPLHAFDLAHLADRQIVVRQATKGEEFLAINHKSYTLDPTVCVIADARRAVGLGGVMGGADTEVSEGTTELLIESAAFDPMSIRNTARALNLHSDSSYRFERALDPQGVDWASRRCCELILELAGGELAAGVLDTGELPDTRQPITLRFKQLKRVLGIDVPPDTARQILVALGNEPLRDSGSDAIEVLPPTWRSDLAREIDLVEEVARIHGYDKIPEDVGVPMVESHRTEADRVLAKVRSVLTAAGFDEAMTASAVEQPWSAAFSPWTDAEPLQSNIPVLRRADQLRRSLVPSLLGSRQINEAVSNPTIELFEIAHVYLPRIGELPCEELMIALASGGDYFAMKGVIEGLLAALDPGTTLEARPTGQALLDADRASELWIRGSDGKDELLGYLGEVGGKGLEQFDLRSPATVAEIRFGALAGIAVMIPQCGEIPSHPAVARDLNLVVDEAVRWADVERTVREAAGPEAESIEFQDVYRDQKRLGAGKKSLLFTLTLRRADRTLTGEEADQVRDRVVEACAKSHRAQLRA